MSTDRKLDRLYRDAERVCFDRNTRIVLMSDCHRGVGNHGDNYFRNKNQAFAALSYYYRRNYVYIELGDGDELWENRNIHRIEDAHEDTFELLKCFEQEGRLFRLYGNHDRQLQKCSSIKEGIVLVEKESCKEVFLVHGHQGDLWNDTLWKLSRFLVRYVWRQAEIWGFHDPTSAARNYRLKKKTEQRLETWAKKHKIMLIAGHTHRPFLHPEAKSLYVNTGSCVHPGCVTAIEIEGNRIALVKWCIQTRLDGSLYIGRTILEGPMELDAF